MDKKIIDFARDNPIQVALLLATALLLLTSLEPTPQEKTTPKRGIKYGKVKKIDENAAREIEIQYDLVEMENEATAHIQPTAPDDGSVPFVVDMPSNAAVYDTADASRGAAPTVDARLEGFLAEREKFEQMEEIRRQEYVDLFKQQAREMGYEVKINSKMEIVDVRKISSEGN